MATSRVFPARVALAVARRLVDELRPACDRIEVAGSLRRQKDPVHDIDIVLLPKHVPERFELGDSKPFERLLIQLVEKRSLTPIRGKEKIKCFVATKTGVPIDVYVATRETWATLLLIRTGSKDHNIKLALRARELGMKLRASGDGIEDSTGQLIRVHAEEEIFKLLRLEYLSPEKRE
jgi:DNA polymerase/3'-5' exonuclease PolX